MACTCAPADRARPGGSRSTPRPRARCARPWERSVIWGGRSFGRRGRGGSGCGTGAFFGRAHRWRQGVGGYGVYVRAGGPVKTEEVPLDPTPAREMRETLAAIRHLEEAVLGAEWTEGIVLRYGVFYGPGTSMAPGEEQFEMIRRRKFPLVGNTLQHPIQDDVFYFLLPDRFNNGDPGNDVGDDPGGSASTEIGRAHV